MNWYDITQDEKECVIRVVLEENAANIADVAFRARVRLSVACEVVSRIYQRYLQSINSPRRKKRNAQKGPRV